MNYQEIAQMNTNARTMEMKNLEDEEILEMFALNDIEDSVKDAAINSIKDQARIEKIARKTRRNSAFRRIESEEVLKKLDLDFTDGGERAIALQKITDQKYIVEKIKGIDFYCYRRCAINESSLTDQHILADFAINDPDSEVRCAARAKITDTWVLEEVLERSSFWPKFRNPLLSLKIAFFGSSEMRRLKKIRSERSTPPALLKKLNSSLQEWDAVAKDCEELEYALSKWETKLAKIEKDIVEYEKAKKETEDVDFPFFYESILEPLRKQKIEFTESRQVVALRLLEANKRREKSRRVFDEAIKISEICKKHDIIMENTLEHQSEIVGFLQEIREESRS